MWKCTPGNKPCVICLNLISPTERLKRMMEHANGRIEFPPDLSKACFSTRTTCDSQASFLALWLETRFYWLSKAQKSHSFRFHLKYEPGFNRINWADRFYRVWLGPSIYQSNQISRTQFCWNPVSVGTNLKKMGTFIMVCWLLFKLATFRL